MSQPSSFYLIRAMQGNFWIRANGAAKAYAIARAILGHDEFALSREADVAFVEVAS